MCSACMIIHDALWRRLKGQLANFRNVSLVAIAPVFYRVLHWQPGLMTQSVANGNSLLSLLAKLGDDLRDPRGQRHLTSVNKAEQRRSRKLLGKRHDGQHIASLRFATIALVGVPNRLVHHNATASGHEDDRAVG